MEFRVIGLQLLIFDLEFAKSRDERQGLAALRDEADSLHPFLGSSLARHFRGTTAFQLLQGDASSLHPFAWESGGLNL